jgi:hypothetical protein
MMCIDKSNGETIILLGKQNILEAAEIAKRERGRLRIVISNSSMSIAEPMMGCMELGDWRNGAVKG